MKSSQCVPSNDLAIVVEVGMKADVIGSFSTIRDSVYQWCNERGYRLIACDRICHKSAYVISVRYQCADGYEHQCLIDEFPEYTRKLPVSTW
jgi:hypothetical protein